MWQYPSDYVVKSSRPHREGFSQTLGNSSPLYLETFSDPTRKDSFSASRVDGCSLTADAPYLNGKTVFSS